MAICFGNLVNINADTSVAQPGAVVKFEEQVIRRCVTADFGNGHADQLLSFKTTVVSRSVNFS